jgi:1-acyl-sn-glycerol-3-phosphate acyltransferase
MSALIRSVLFNLILWPALGIYLTLMYPFAYFLSKRFSFKFVYRMLTKILLFCLKHIVCIDYEIRNFEKVKEITKSTNVIIGCNHQSAWETFIFVLLFDTLSIVVKKELLRIPIAGLYFRKLECLPVDRSSPVSSIRSLLKYGKTANQNRENILIFPNGTRSSFDSVTEYKSGIFALYKFLNIPVIPAYVNSGKYWPRRSLKKTRGTIILEFKQAIYPGLDKEKFFKTFENCLQTRC